MKALKWAPIVLTLVLLWSGAILLSTHLLVPLIYAVQYVDGVACLPRTADTNIIRPARYTFTAIWILLGGVTPVVVSIVVPILVLCYIRRNRVTQSNDYNKGIAKFALFLVSGNLIDLFGQAVVTAIVYLSDTPAVYLSYSIHCVEVTNEWTHEHTHICIIIYMHFVIRASAMDMYICTHCTSIYRYVGITCLI